MIVVYYIGVIILGGLIFVAIIIYIIVTMIKKINDASYDSTDSSTDKYKGYWYNNQGTSSYTNFNRYPGSNYDAGNDSRKDIDTDTYSNNDNDDFIAADNNSFNSGNQSFADNGSFSGDYPGAVAGYSSCNEDKYSAADNSIEADTDNMGYECRPVPDSVPDKTRKESVYAFADAAAYTNIRIEVTEDVRTDMHEGHHTYDTYVNKRIDLKPDPNAFTFSDVVIDAQVQVDAVMPEAYPNGITISDN